MFCRNSSITGEHQHHRLGEGLHHFLDRQPHESELSWGENHRIAIRKLGASWSMQVFTAAATASAFAPGAICTAKPAAGCLPTSGRSRARNRPPDPRHVLEPHRGAVVGAQQDVLELLRGGSALPPTPWR